jgi:glycosyltransferase involved in cell wall biosynthesis
MGSESAIVSILTPSFNQGRFIADCILSVRGQTYRQVEHVIQDAGSTDGTLTILYRSQSTYDLHWLSERDAGQADALNRALRRSSGEIVGWVNADDGYPTPNSVALAVEAFRSNPDVGLVYGHALLIDSGGRIIRILPAPRWRQDLLVARCFIYQPTVFVRREVVEHYGFVRNDLNIGMDYDLWLRLAQHGIKFLRLDHFMGIDRHHRLRKLETARQQMKVEMNAIRPKPSTAARVGSRLTDVRLRLRGSALIPRLAREPLFPFLRRPSPGIMALQQIALPRRLTS